jgi:hypothetical protein
MLGWADTFETGWCTDDPDGADLDTKPLDDPAPAAVAASAASVSALPASVEELADGAVSGESEGSAAATPWPVVMAAPKPTAIAPTRSHCT